MTAVVLAAPSRPCHSDLPFTIRVEMLCGHLNQILLHGLAAYDVLLYDLLQRLRGAGVVVHLVGVHHRNGALGAHAQAVGLGAPDRACRLAALLQLERLSSGRKVQAVGVAREGQAKLSPRSGDARFQLILGRGEPLS